MATACYNMKDWLISVRIVLDVVSWHLMYNRNSYSSVCFCKMKKIQGKSLKFVVCSKGGDRQRGRNQVGWRQKRSQHQQGKKNNLCHSSHLLLTYMYLLILNVMPATVLPPVPTFSKPVAGIKFKMIKYFKYFSLSTFDMFSLYYFLPNIGFKWFASHCVQFVF